MVELWAGTAQRSLTGRRPETQPEDNVDVGNGPTYDMMRIPDRPSCAGERGCRTSEKEEEYSRLSEARKMGRMCLEVFRGRRRS